ncbi:MAG: hypothetical protein AAF487_13710, partial [Bacteroidota bacterium]
MTVKSKTVLIASTAALILAAVIIAFSIRTSSTSGTTSSSTCPQIISSSPGPAPYSLIEIGKEVQFKFDSRFSPLAYPSPMVDPPYPDYNIQGYSFFTAFPDGRYTWAPDPIRDFGTSGIHSGILQEFTLSKDDDDPPLSIISDIDICHASPPSSAYAPHLLRPGEHIQLDYSRPLYAGVSFTQIVSYGHTDANGTGLVTVNYDSRLRLLKLINTNDPDLKITRNDAGILIVEDDNIQEGEQKALLIQFDLSMETCEKCRCADLNISARFEFNDAEETVSLTESASNTYSVLSCGPYDPCFFELPEFCEDETPEVFEQEVCSFFYENGDPEKRKVEFEFETSRNLEILGINQKSKAHYKEIDPKGSSVFTCESRSKLGGVKGHLSSDLKPINCLL